jgi:hypothetical protein
VADKTHGPNAVGFFVECSRPVAVGRTFLSVCMGTRPSEKSPFMFQSHDRPIRARNGLIFGRTGQVLVCAVVMIGQ